MDKQNHLNMIQQHLLRYVFYQFLYKVGLQKLGRYKLYPIQKSHPEIDLSNVQFNFNCIYSILVMEISKILIILQQLHLVKTSLNRAEKIYTQITLK
jgi:hypothetical protein